MRTGLLALCCLVAAATMSPAFAAQQPPLTDTVYLSATTSIDITANAYGANTLRTYCYPGQPHSLLSLFETVEFQLDILNDDYSEYGGRSPTEVLQHYEEQRSLFSITLFSQKRQRVQLSPFEQQCIGVATKQPYNVRLKRVSLDLWRFLQLAAGLLVFCIAGRLAKNSVFYYLAGIVLGICASLLVIIAITAKLFPKRPMMYGVLIGGWTIGFYILKQLADNMRLILVTYREYVLWYLVVTGLISFLVCYRIGPPRNPRSQHIIKWVLQAMGGVLMYFSSWHTSAAIAIMVVSFVAHYFPSSLLNWLGHFYKRRFPQKRRLLTLDEYYEQTVAETARSLAELREHVNSPECRQWHMMSRLRNPTRFANFANGAPHLFDEEIEDYSRTIDDEFVNLDEEYLQCNMYYRPPSQRRPIPRQGLQSPPLQRLAPVTPLSRHYAPAAPPALESDDEEEYLDE